MKFWIRNLKCLKGHNLWCNLCEIQQSVYSYTMRSTLHAQSSVHDTFSRDVKSPNDTFPSSASHSFDISLILLNFIYAHMYCHGCHIICLHKAGIHTVYKNTQMYSGVSSLQSSEDYILVPAYRFWIKKSPKKVLKKVFKK